MVAEGIVGLAGGLSDVQNPPDMADTGRPRPFGAVVRDLLIEQGRVTAIGNPNWMEFAQGLDGVSYESLRKAVTGERPAGPKIIEAVASALGVEPESFWEYQLWAVQRSFDPREVGEEQAFANLQAWVDAQARKKK